MSVYLWKNISWNTDYNKDWYYNNDTAHLKKCFNDVFNLEFVLNTAGGGFEAYLENNATPVLKLKGGASVTIKGFGSSVKLRMRRSGSDNSSVQEANITTSGYVNLNGMGDGQLFFFGEIGIAIMDAFQAYLFHGERLDSLNSQTPYLQDAVRVIQGAATISNNTEFEIAYSTVDKDHISSVNNNTIKKELLNQVGINKITIPRYKISENNNEYHFEGLSFPNNRTSMNDEQKASGQFCHDNDLQLSSTEQFDALYWSTKPHIYPEIVLDTHENLVEKEKDITHSITLTDTQLSIDSNTYVIHPNDIVVAYVRKNRSWQSNVDKDTPGWNVGANGGNYGYVKPKHIQTYDATGNFTSTGAIYQLNNMTASFRCVSDTSAEAVFSSNGTNVSTHPCWGKLYTQHTTQVEMYLKTADHSSDATWDGVLTGNRLISFCIGEYSWNGKVVNKEMTKTSDCNLKYTATVVWDAFGTQSSSTDLVPTCTSACYLAQLKHNVFSYSGVGEVDYSCVSDSNHITGTYNSILGVLPPSFSYLNTWKYEKTEETYYSTGMDTYTCKVSCNIGYKSVVESSNCGVAIVIWRNGKMVKNPNGSENASGGDINREDGI